MMNMNSIWNVSQKSILNKFIKYQFHLNSLSIFRYMANYNFTNCLPIKYSSFLKLSKSKNLPMICQNQESYHLPDGLRDAQRSCAASCQTLQYYTQIMPWLSFVNNQRNVEIYYYFKYRGLQGRIFSLQHRRLDWSSWRNFGVIHWILIFGKNQRSG